jgi:DNA-binding transcriptional LysR family regulator
MRFKSLDLNLLVALDALLAHRSISRAAEAVFLTQSGMSGALSRLRAYFDDELLIQVGRSLELTPLAESIAQPVREVLLSIESQIVNRPTFDPATDDHTYRIMVSELTLILLMPALTQRLAREAPNIRLHVQSQHDRAVEALERGELDLLVLPEQVASASHPCEKLYEENYDCLVWTGNTTIGETLLFEEYLEAGHISVEFGPNRVAAFDGWFLEQHGVNRRVELICTSLIAPPVLVVGTQRIATVHRRLAHLAAQYLPVRVLNAPMKIPPLNQMVQWHKHRDSSPALVWLRKVLVEEAAKL